MSKLLPQVKVLDPDMIKDYSQFTQMESVCFTDPPEQTSMIFVDQVNSVHARLLNSNEKKSQYSTTSVQSVPTNNSDMRKRSQTPNRDQRERSKSQIAKQENQGESHLKSTIISPSRLTMES